MFGGSSKKKGKGKGKKGKGKKANQAQTQGDAQQQQQEQQQQFQTDANGNPYGDTEKALLRLHQNLIDFYVKHNPENVHEEVLTILMQFFIDAGGVALNKKLMDKYGEDLQTFQKLDGPPPLPSDNDVSNSRRTSATLDRMKRQASSNDLEKMGIDVPPPPGKIETTATRDSMDMTKPIHSKNYDIKPRKKKVLDDPELMKYKTEKKQEISDVNGEVDAILNMGPSPTTSQSPDEKLGLFHLDHPSDTELSARDKIEAFYSVHDEAKLDSERSMEKFVMWVKENSLEALSKKLKGKYQKGLEDYNSLALRRRNLEDMLTQFYLKHDRPKLDTRWTILKILTWTMKNGVPALNKKFTTRYGHLVVNVHNSSGNNGLDNELDI